MMRPFIFDDCAGWLHDAPGALGVVICAPQGYEQLCAQSSLRQLAERLAARGLPTLRFDYPGCGDSLGDDDEPDRIEAWRASVPRAIDALRQSTGVANVAVIGLRLGGVFALEAASGRADVAAVALLAPIVSGRAYRRELTAFAGMTGGPADASGSVAVAGFRAAAATLAELDRIDLTRLEAAPTRIFLATPADQPGGDKLARRLADLGAAVDRAPFEGYADLLADPTFAKPPTELFTALADWLAALEAPPRAAPALGRATAETPLIGDGFADQPIVFDQGRLAGALCRPLGSARQRAVLFLNAGANPHMGWARQTVRFARALARLGWTSLRIDAAGLGDSPIREGRPTEIPYSDEPQADVIAALDELAAQGFDEVAVIGPCSGAHLGFHTALRDRRIALLAMINLQAFVWTPGRSLTIAIRQSTRSTSHYRQRMFELQTWKRLVTGGLDLRTIASGVASLVRRRLTERLARLTQPSARGDTIESRFETLSGRGQRVLVVYSDNDGGLDELATHLGPNGARLSHIPGMRVSLLPDADHNLTSQDMQARLLELLIPFLSEGDRQVPRAAAHEIADATPLSAATG